MAINFFEHQERARKKTGQLVLLFLLAVLAIIAAVYASFYAIVSLSGKKGPILDPTDPFLFLVITGGTLGVIALGTAYKIVQLREGGSAIAQALGGRKIPRTTTNLDERKILNVVEEMAIASGCRVPEVYLLEESSINAFAAGFHPNEAVIGITRGAIERLSRDELQGVIAHEFSHIFNGDMKLNIQLIGVIHGIIVINLIGYWLLRSLRFSGRSRSREKGGGGLLAILLFGLALFLIGLIGAFFGRLIQAAVSRQREFLADASAVQFTRNPRGIGGALKKIARLTAGSLIQHPNAGQAAHLFFGQGVAFSFGGLLATHPPIEERIQRVMQGLAPEKKRRSPAPAAQRGAPGHRREPPRSPEEARKFLQDFLAGAAVTGTAAGGAVAATLPESKKRSVLGALGTAAAAGAASIPPPEPSLSSAPSLERKTEPSPSLSSETRAVLSSIGTPSENHFAYARVVLESIPEKIRKACEEPCGAAAVVYALLLDSDPAIRRKQLEYLESRLGKPVAEETRRISAPVSRLGEAFFIPIADLALVSLKDLSEPQKEAFREAVGFLSEADRQLSLFEYTLQQMIFRRLQTSAEKQRGAAVAGTDAVLENACVLLSVTARMGHWEETEIQRAFLAGRARIEDLFPKARDLSLLPLSDLSYPRITAAIEALSRAPFPQQECLLAALTDTVLLDGTVTIQEAEILRAIADGLGAPVPPLLPSELTEAS